MKKGAFLLGIFLCLASIFSIARLRACDSRAVAGADDHGSRSPRASASASTADPAAATSMLKGRVLDANGQPTEAEIHLFEAPRLGALWERPCQAGHPALIRCDCPAATSEIARWIEEGAFDDPIPRSTALSNEQGFFELAVPAARPFWLDVGERPARRSRACLRVSSLRELEESLTRAGEEEEGTDRLRIRLQETIRIAGRALDRRGHPIDGAEVAALPLFFPSAARVVRTSADGAFAFDDLWAGPHRLVAVAPGYLPGSLALVNPAAHGEAIAIVLGAPHAIAGRVIGLDGRPADSARVRLGADGGVTWGETLETGGDGRFAFEGLSPGDYELFASLGDALAQAHARVPPPEPEEGEAGSEVEIELHLFRGRRVSGKVMDAISGRSLPGARVSASLLGVAGASAVSDASGAFTLRGVLPGSTLTASADGFQSRTISRAPGADTDAEVDFSLAPLLVVEGRIAQGDGLPAAGLQVILTQGSEQSAAMSDASGRFRFEVERPGAARLEVHHSALGSALLAVDVPVSGVELRLDVGARIAAQLVAAGNSRPISGGHMRVARGSPAARKLESETLISDLPSGLNGDIAVAGLRGGVYDVIFSASGFREARFSDVRLAASQRLDLGEVELSEGATIEGKVLMPSGEPAPGARVTAFQAASDAKSALSDSEGRFAFEGLDDTIGQEAGVELTAERDEAFAKKWVSLKERFVELRLEASAHAISGRLLDARARPVPRFSVNDRLFNVPDGRFELPVEPAAQTRAREEGFSLAILVPGEPALRQIVELMPGARTDLGDLFLESAARVEGRVVNGEGQPIAGAVVTAGGDPRAEGMVTSGADGSFALEGIPRDSRIHLTACRDGVCAERFLAIPAEADLVEEVTLTLPWSGAIEGEVRDRRGNPIAGARLTLLSDPSKRTIADDSGRYRLAPIEAVDEGSPRTAVQCQFEHSDGRIISEVRAVDVRPRQVAELDFVLESASASLSAVIDSEAARYALLIPDDMDWGQSSSLQIVPFVDGTARFEHLPAGHYLLLVRSQPWTRALASRRIALSDGEVVTARLTAGVHAADIDESLAYFDL